LPIKKFLIGLYHIDGGASRAYNVIAKAQ